MSSGFPTGERDGQFVKFVGWDVPGNDVGRYYQNLPAGPTRNAALKAAALQFGSRFFAFNTNGFAKSWSKLTASSFVRVNGSTLWIRVEYPGWTFQPRESNIIGLFRREATDSTCHI